MANSPDWVLTLLSTKCQDNFFELGGLDLGTLLVNTRTTFVTFIALYLNSILQRNSCNYAVPCVAGVCVCACVVD